jgi:hypothetical protein
LRIIMRVYQTDAQGYFVGVTTADADPLNPTEWLIPGGCVIEAPHDAPDGSMVKWDGSQWVNEVIPVEPEPEPTPQDVLVRNVRDSLLAATDWAASSDLILSDEMRTYRQALRDVPSQVGFPDDVTWPVKP